MDEFKLLRRIIKSINHAIRIFEDGGMDPQHEWEIKYNKIFSLHIWQDIEHTGMTFDWVDPDTSFHEDISSYVNTLRGMLPRIEQVLQEELEVK